MNNFGFNRHPLERFRAFFYGSALLILLSACNFPVSSGGTEAPTIRPDDMKSAYTRTRESQAPGIETTEGAEPDTTETPTPTETVAHRRTPGEPGAVMYSMGDFSSKASSAYKAASGGDYFVTNLYERPFTAEEMEYLPGIDILRADIGKDGTWLYMTIRLEEAPEPGARYGVEVDAEMDGRGDYLIWTEAPAGTEWTTDGVQIWEDGNNDVGGIKPLRTETGWTGDGYEKLAFDAGRGEDPDAAWARISPGNPKYVQIALLQEAIGNDLEFLWSVWADIGVQKPEWFDYNDRLTVSQAGSPMKGQADYPLKALAAVDNTCRMSFGFTLIGDEPGACPVFQPTATLTPTRTPTATQTTVPFQVTAVNIYFDRPSETGSCPFVIGLHVNATTTAAGYVYFDVYRAADGAPLTFWVDSAIIAHSAGLQSVILAVYITDSQVLRMQARVTSPNALNSNTTTVTITCT
jgi:hypothetical protein